MFEYHGWVVIVDSAGCDDELEDPHPRTLERVRAELELVRLGTGSVALTVSNGDHTVSINGLNNHRNPDVVQLFEQLGRIAPGSYGVLFTHDTEAGLGKVPKSLDETGENPDDWYRRVMVRGRVRREREAAFSPNDGTLFDVCPE